MLRHYEISRTLAVNHAVVSEHFAQCQWIAIGASRRTKSQARTSAKAGAGVAYSLEYTFIYIAES